MCCKIAYKQLTCQSSKQYLYIWLCTDAPHWRRGTTQETRRPGTGRPAGDHIPGHASKYEAPLTTTEIIKWQLVMGKAGADTEHHIWL